MNKNLRIARELIRLAKSISAQKYYSEFAECLKSKGWVVDEHMIASKTIRMSYGVVSLSVDVEEADNAAYDGFVPQVYLEILDQTRGIKPYEASNLAHIVDEAEYEVDSCYNRR